MRLIQLLQDVNEGEAWRGPHQGKELALMLAGTKLVAMPNNYEEFAPYVAQKRFVARAVRKAGKNREMIVAQPDRVDLIDQIEILYRGIRDLGQMTLRDHRKLGEILGYDPNDIDKFIIYMRDMDQGKQRTRYARRTSSGIPE